MRSLLVFGVCLYALDFGAVPVARAQTAAGDADADADSDRDVSPPEEGAPEARPERTARVEPLTPSFLGPGRAAPLVYVGAEGGWDGARRGPIMETNIEAAIVGPVSFRAGASVNPADGRATPSLALKVDFLDQSRHGIGAAAFGGYRGAGFTQLPSMEVGLLLGRRSDRFSFVSALAVGTGVRRTEERYGDVRVAALARVHRRANVNVGLDARARFDLEYDSDEPAGELAFDGTAGPIIVLGIGRFALSGQAGVEVLAPRASGPTQVGATGRVGLAAAF